MSVKTHRRTDPFSTRTKFHEKDINSSQTLPYNTATPATKFQSEFETTSKSAHIYHCITPNISSATYLLILFRFAYNHGKSKKKKKE